MHNVCEEHSLDDLFGIDFLGARVQETFSTGANRWATVMHAEVTNSAFIMFMKLDQGLTERVELFQGRGNPWYVQMPDAERVVIEHVPYALDRSVKILMKLNGPQPISYEFHLKV